MNLYACLEAVNCCTVRSHLHSKEMMMRILLWKKTGELKIMLTHADLMNPWKREIERERDGKAVPHNYTLDSDPLELMPKPGWNLFLLVDKNRVFQAFCFSPDHKTEAILSPRLVYLCFAASWGGEIWRTREPFRSSSARDPDRFIGGHTMQRHGNMTSPCIVDAQNVLLVVSHTNLLVNSSTTDINLFTPNRTF